jgi:hypothetical protein
MPERRLSGLAVAASFRQAGILVNDGSPSMLDPVAGEGAGGMSKGAAVGIATAGLISRLAASRNHVNFSLAGVDFHGSVGRVWGPKAVAEIDTTANFDPTDNGADGTSVSAGLFEAERLLQGFFSAERDGLPSSAVVLVCSDGECATPEETRRVAARLKSDPRVIVACAYFATEGQPNVGLPLLQEICSSPSSQYCILVHDAETLRRFWEASMRSGVRALPAASGGRP